MEIEPPVNGFFEFFSPNKEVDQNKPDNTIASKNVNKRCSVMRFSHDFYEANMSPVIPTTLETFKLPAVMGKKVSIGEQCFINIIDRSEVIAFVFQSLINLTGKFIHDFHSSLK